MRIDCHTYGHWKDLLICAMSCPYTFRCKQFAQWKEDEDNQHALWDRVLNYIRRHPNHPYEAILTPLESESTKTNTKDKTMSKYVCVREENISLLSEEEITQALLQGTMFDEIYELGRPMELQIRLVPAKKTSSRKSSAEQSSDDSDENDDSDEQSQEDETPNGATTGSRGRKKKSAQATASVH